MPIRLENVGIAVRDLDATIAFFTDLGLTVAGRATVSGEWALWQTRPHVELVDNTEDGIDHISGRTIHTRNGAAHDVDVILLATGYKVARMLATLPLEGRDGLSIRQAWNDAASPAPRANGSIEMAPKLDTVNE